jgi:hypothetical protein
VRVDSSQDHPQELLDRAIRGELGASERPALEQHLADCPMCVVELEAARIFRASVAPGRQDEALYRAVIDGAMERLKKPETLGEKVRRWMGRDSTLRPAVGLAALGVAAAVVVGFVLFHTQQPIHPSSAPVAASRPLILDDGSEVTPTTADTAIQVAEQAPTRTTVRLRSGSAQFRVRHDSRRRFCVDTGAMEIEDLGTVFRVSHEASGKITVAVSEGRVAVLYPANFGLSSALERAGGSILYPVPGMRWSPRKKRPRCQHLPAQLRPGRLSRPALAAPTSLPHFCWLRISPDGRITPRRRWRPCDAS